MRGTDFSVSTWTKLSWKIWGLFIFSSYTTTITVDCQHTTLILIYFPFEFHTHIFHISVHHILIDCYEVNVKHMKHNLSHYPDDLKVTNTCMRINKVYPTVLGSRFWQDSPLQGPEDLISVQVLMFRLSEENSVFVALLFTNTSQKTGVALTVSWHYPCEGR